MLAFPAFPMSEMLKKKTKMIFLIWRVGWLVFCFILKYILTIECFISFYALEKAVKAKLLITKGL